MRLTRHDWEEVIQMILIVWLVLVIARMILFPGRVPWERQTRGYTTEQIAIHEEADRIRENEERRAK